MPESPSRLSAGLLLGILGCGSSTPLPELERFDPAVTPGAEDYPDVPGLVLLDRGTLELTIDAKTRNPIGRLRCYKRVKILRPSGIELGRVVVPYDPGSAVAALVVRATLPSGELVDVNADNIVDTPHESGRRAKAVQVQGAGPGAIIEYAYDLYIGDLRFLPPWVFQTSIPTVRSEYAVVVPRGFSVDLRFSQDAEFIERPPERFDVDEGTRFSWSETNLPARFSEPGMPSSDLLSPRAHVIFLGANIGGRDYAGFSSWDDVGAWFVSRAPEWAKLGAATIQEAKRIAGETSVEEQALKLLVVVARDVGWEPGPRLRLWQSRLVHPEIVLEEKVANASSRGLLLVSLLRAIGIPAVPALVAYRDRGVLLPDVPTVYDLDGVIALVPRDQGALLLDPSQLTVSADVPSWRIQGSRIVALREDGAEVLLVPSSAPRDSRTAVSYDLKLGGQGDLFGTMEAKLTGAEAGMLRALLLSSEPVRYAEVVSSFLHERGAGLPIESASILDLTELRRPLGVRGTVSIRRAVPREGTSVPIPLARLVGSAEPQGILREVRRAPLKIGAPREVEIIVTLTLPEDHEPESLPEPFSDKWPGGDLDIRMRLESPHRVGVVRRGVVTVLDVPTGMYAAYRRFREAVERAERQMFTVKRPPPRSFEY